MMDGWSLLAGALFGAAAALTIAAELLARSNRKP